MEILLEVRNDGISIQAANIAEEQTKIRVMQVLQTALDLLESPAEKTTTFKNEIVMTK